MQFSFIWPIDRTLSGATTLGQSGPGSDGNEGVLHIPQSYNITGPSLSDCLASYTGHSLRRESYSSAEVQSVYSTAPAHLARGWVNTYYYYYYKYILSLVCSILKPKKTNFKHWHIVINKVFRLVCGTGPNEWRI